MNVEFVVVWQLAGNQSNTQVSLYVFCWGEKQPLGCVKTDEIFFVFVVYNKVCWSRSHRFSSKKESKTPLFSITSQHQLLDNSLLLILFSQASKESLKPTTTGDLHTFFGRPPCTVHGAASSRRWWNKCTQRWERHLTFAIGIGDNLLFLLRFF